MYVRSFAVAGICLIALACGGKDSPTGPSGPAGSVSVSNFTVTATAPNSTGAIRYNATARLTEVGGVGVTVNTITFQFGPNNSANYSAVPITIAPTASQTIDVNINDSPAATIGVTSVTMVINFSDASGRAGSTNATATVDRAVRVTITGVITATDTNRPLVGATVTAINVLTDTNVTARTDGNGFYSLPGVSTGTVNLDWTAPNYISQSDRIAITGDLRRDIRLDRRPPDVEYRITGTARRCSATYRNSSGGTNQASVAVPFSYTWDGARTNDFLYMSCQIDTGGDNGSIRVELLKRGSVVQSATANGFPNIATVSGSY